jgi:diguanylate cyclase (GGDEF)-like protein
MFLAFTSRGQVSSWLPRGRTLAPEQSSRRHQALRRLLWAHAIGLPLFAWSLGGLSALQDVVYGVPLVAFAVLSGRGSNARHQAVAVSLGLMTASALLVHASHGAVEAHFHFFVMLSLLTLYEDWLTYGVAAGYVLTYSAVIGMLFPRDVLGHSGHPAAWAAVQTAFIFAAGATNLVTWRMNELSRDQAAAALAAVQTQYEVTGVLAAAVSLDDAVPRLLDVIGRRLDWSMGLFWNGDPGRDRLHPASVWVADAARQLLMDDTVVRDAYARGESISRQAWDTRRPAWAESFSPDDSCARPDFVRRVEQRSGLALPVCSGGQVLGALAFTSTETRAFDDGLVALLENVSSQIGLFMERLRRSDEIGVLQTVAMTDPLTELPNRRSWDERLPRELERAQQVGQPLCVALIDLDHFKAYNDSHGHGAGDRLLAEAGAAWSEAIRDNDLLVRYGGEEFAVILPTCGLEEAYAILERLRAVVPGEVTCSVGLARWNGKESARALVERADEALYAAKRAGRNRLALAAPPLISAA